MHELKSFRKNYYNGDVALRPYCACGWIGKWTQARRGLNEATELSEEQQIEHLESIQAYVNFSQTYVPKSEAETM
jgi:hypothetical protein